MLLRIAHAVLVVSVFLCGCQRGEDIPAPELGPLPVASSPEPFPLPPVVLLVLIDTLRADHVGAYGSISGLTPTLDELASRAFVFENAIAPSSWTRSSIASLHTSRHPSSAGVLDRADVLVLEHVTLAEALAAHGWQTIAFVTNGHVGAHWGFDQGFERFERTKLRRGYPDDFQIPVAEGVTTLALEAAAGRDRNRPLFLYLHYVDPHDPYLPHPELGEIDGSGGRFDGSRRELSRLDRLSAPERTEADELRIRRLYAGEVRYCDAWIGKLFQGLDDLGLFEDALVIVTSDHGEGLWDHGKRFHGTDLYEEQIHVPLIVRYPGMQAGDAQRIAEPVSLVDVAPTILSATRIDRPGEFEGHDFLPLARDGERPAALDWIYAELDFDGRNVEMIRHGSRKLIRPRGLGWRGFLDRREELYDLERDPGETTNLVGSAGEGPLRTALDRWSDAILSRAVARVRIPPEEMEEKLLRELRGLGYVQ